MKKLNRKLILETAHEMVLEQGIEKVTLSKVGKKLGKSHTALYKYFNGKEELWTTLALSWLDQELADLFPFRTKEALSTPKIIHDWFWILCQSKYLAYKRDPEMFELYTTYIDNNPAVLMQHMADLIKSLGQASKIQKEETLFALIQAFSYFSSPRNAWNWPDKLDKFQQEFEAVFRLIHIDI
ncbi:TetR/AcrR family transcriptional regulator [Listeria aquatica]|uniref:TetR/AcrR family transcriptional regulator n=1 Tax=Listeria aquatica TaxID=1494960 RepID=UPI003F6F9C10